MNRLVYLICPVLLAALASGCAHMRDDPESAPAYTFGEDGTVGRNGGLLTGRREYCPTCEWAGRKCPTCAARDAERAWAMRQGAVAADDGVVMRQASKRGARSGRKSGFIDAGTRMAVDDASGPSSPYAQVHMTTSLRTSARTRSMEE
jgi:hypothetical protein